MAISSAEEDRVVMTVKEAAAFLRISRGLAYEMVRRGALPQLRLGKRILIPRAALERMLAEAGRQPPEDEARALVEQYLERLR